MRFLLDQSAEARIATFLTDHGHDATRIAREYPPGLPNQQVLAIARAEHRILITNDRDFGELIFRRGLPHAGVIYFRLGLGSSSEEKIARLEQLLESHPDHLDQFLVVTERSVRARKSSRAKKEVTTDE